MTEIVEAVVEAFNDCINRRDIEGLSRLMTDGHRFVDSGSGSMSGKNACLDAWQRFFLAFPDYRNHFNRMITTGSTAVIVGRSTCADHRLEGPALWRVVVSAERIDEWRVLEDTPANRLALGLPD